MNSDNYRYTEERQRKIRGVFKCAVTIEKLLKDLTVTENYTNMR